MNSIQASKKPRLMFETEIKNRSPNSALPSQTAGTTPNPESLITPPRRSQKTSWGAKNAAPLACATPLACAAPRALSAFTAITPAPSSTPKAKNLNLKDQLNEFLPLSSGFAEGSKKQAAAAEMSRIKNNLKGIVKIHLATPTPNSKEKSAIEKVRHDGKQLSAISRADRTLAVCQAALRNNIMAWPFIPKNLREAPELGLAEIAVRNNGLALSLISPRQQTRALREMAVANNAWALEYVKTQHITPAMYESLHDQALQNGLLLNFINPKSRTQAMYETAMAQKMVALKAVPLPMRSEKIYHYAVRADGLQLALVPESMRDTALCIAALQSNPEAHVFVPKNLKNNFEFWLAAIKKGANVLPHMAPEHRANGEIEKLALKKNGLNLKHIAEQNRSPSLCALAIKENPAALEFVPQLLAPFFWEQAVAEDGESIRFIIDKHSGSAQTSSKRYQDLMDLAITSDSDALAFLPAQERTINRCLAAVQNNIDAIEFVPIKHLKKNTTLIKAALAYYQAICDYPLSSTKTIDGSASPFTPTTQTEGKVHHPETDVSQLMILHMMKLSNDTDIALKDNPLCQGIPEEWILQAQVCIDLLAGFNFDQYVVGFMGHNVWSKNACNQSFSQELQRRAFFASGNTLPGTCFMAAIAIEPLALERVPLAARTEALCQLAVKKNGLALQFVPPHSRNEEICLSAFSDAGPGAFPFMTPAMVEQLT